MVLNIRVQSQYSAKIHWVHVLVGATHYLLHNKSISLLWWVKSIPKHKQISIGTQVWCWCAESNPIVRSLPTTCHFRGNKSCKTPFHQMPFHNPFLLLTINYVMGTMWFVATTFKSQYPQFFMKFFTLS